MAQIHENDAGVFFKISKIEHGRFQSIVVPGEKEEEGWRLLYGNLKRCLEGREIRWNGMKANEEEVIRKEGSIVNSRYRGGEAVKSWKLAVMVWRSSVNISWFEISKQLGNILGRKCKVTTTGIDRGILWCKDEEEKEKAKISVIQPGLKNKGEWIKVEDWTEDSQRKDLKIKAKKSWIGIEGLPLNMWNIHVFRVLGNLCGGFIQVAKETLEKRFLQYVKIKVVGFWHGFLKATLEVPCDGEVITLGLSSLSSQVQEIIGLRTGGVTTKPSQRTEKISRTSEKQTTGFQRSEEEDNGDGRPGFRSREGFPAHEPLPAREETYKQVLCKKKTTFSNVEILGIEEAGAGSGRKKSGPIEFKLKQSGSGHFGNSTTAKEGAHIWRKEDVREEDTQRRLSWPQVKKKKKEFFKGVVQSASVGALEKSRASQYVTLMHGKMEEEMEKKKRLREEASKETLGKVLSKKKA